jgi:hypothetical protein
MSNINMTIVLESSAFSKNYNTFYVLLQWSQKGHSTPVQKDGPLG